MATFTGTNDPDRLSGSITADVMTGLAGDDWVNGIDGDDRIDGGDGQDVLSGDAGDDYILGGRDNDLLEGWDGNDLLHGGGGRDQLQGGEGNDQIFGADGRDTLAGQVGDDDLSGGGGDDFLSGGAGNDRLSGGGGRDVFSFNVTPGAEYDFQESEIGQDIAADFVRGQDIIHMARTIDTESGPFTSWKTFADLDTNGNGVLDEGDAFIAIRDVTLDGVTQASTVIDMAGVWELGERGSQTVTVFGVTDLGAGDIRDFDKFPSRGIHLNGGPGADVLVGTPRDDYIRGSTMVGGDRGDILRGLGGDDSLNGGLGSDRLEGGDGLDDLLGGEGDDQLFGGAGDDRLWGEPLPAAIETLTESMNDYLNGGAGDDRLYGSFGRDVLTGGQGRDVFGVEAVGRRFTDGSRPEMSVLVTDFVRGEDVLDDETISFNRYDFNGDGQIRGSDAYVTLQQVTYNDETKLSLVISLRADDATAASGKLTLFGVTGLDATDFLGRTLVDA
ncbi:calcium-binding protein [Geminicoccus roseus]|uniref:calcium-binding protein n=1 Tax=Geminicoccus roseus TaxID=404900 RepID=UPI0003FF2DE6|nr:calcium-binding protein [Geminicoccus roseus]